MKMLLTVTTGVLLSVGCSESGKQPTAGLCEFRTQAIGASATAPNGVDVAALLARVSGNRSASVTWGLPATDASLQVTPATGTTTAELEFIPDTSKVTYREATASECRSAVEVPGAVRFSTADGSFSETETGTIKATSNGAATLVAPIAISGLKGSFQVVNLDSNVTKTSAELSATFDDGFHGSVVINREKEMAAVSPDVPAADMSQTTPVARW